MNDVGRMGIMALEKSIIFHKCFNIKKAALNTSPFNPRL
jgi:hypothetical protein